MLPLGASHTRPPPQAPSTCLRCRGCLPQPLRRAPSLAIATQFGVAFPPRWLRVHGHTQTPDTPQRTTPCWRGGPDSPAARFPGCDWRSSLTQSTQPGSLIWGDRPDWVLPFGQCRWGSHGVQLQPILCCTAPALDDTRGVGSRLSREALCLAPLAALTRSTSVSSHPKCVMPGPAAAAFHALGLAE